MPRHKQERVLTEAEAREQLIAAKRLLKEVRAQEREHTILTLGTLAYNAGLQHLDQAYLINVFRQLGQGVILAAHVKDQSEPVTLAVAREDV
jgi:hypothetical protein